MRKEDRVDLQKETNIIFGVCREKVSGCIPEKVFTKNISGGGMCIVSGTELKKGTVLGAEVLLNTQGMEKFKAYCEAVWSRKLDSEDGYEVGLQFIDLKPTDEKNLRQFLQSYIYN